VALTPGTRIGSYEIAAQIGAGGMGEVYRATDTNLARQVAIKVLPDAVACDAERLARFDREAKTLAALNHPNIAHIYGLERSEGQTALVMELVEGPTLADRIAEGPIPVGEALAIAKQIAEALEAAHEQGIVHRDLKPANVKVRPDGTVKVLDFGLAKALEPAGALSSSQSMSPTITTPAMTQAGFILGTAAYMSPEQAKGRTVDARADVWAFGAVLFEMLSGRRAFDGEDTTDVLGAVVRLEPNWHALPAAVPERITRVLQVCLLKDPRQRAFAIHDVRLALDGAFEGSPSAGATQQGPSGWRLALPLAAVAALVAVLGTAWVMRSGEPAAEAITRFAVTLPANQTFTATMFRIMALSPDGRRLAYVANNQLYVQGFDDWEASPVPGSENSDPRGIVFSPDGEWLAYLSLLRGQIMRLPITGGSPVPITVIPAGGMAYGLEWSSDDVLLFVNGKGIWRARADGSDAELLVETEPGESADAPQLLPGDRLLFALAPRGASSSNRWDEASIVVQSLRSGERTIVWKGGGSPRYLPTGHLLYTSDGRVLAVPLELDPPRLRGTPKEVVDGIQVGTAPAVRGNAANFRLSDRGTLAFVPGGSVTFVRDLALVSVDRDGVETAIDEPAAAYLDPRVSPDGQRIAVAIDEAFNTDIWVLDLRRGGRVRLTLDPAIDRYPLWTPDGRYVLFTSFRDGTGGIYRKAADGSGLVEEVASDADRTLVPWSWSSDAQTVTLSELALTGDTGYDIGSLDVSGDATRTPLLEEAFVEGQPVVSPDGRWMAYVSYESGRGEVYVRPFPDVASGRNAVSTDGGENPVWSRDGRELYYRNGDAVMAVGVQTAPSFQAGTPVELFRGRYFNEIGTQWDVGPEEGQFVMLRSAPGDEDSPELARARINVVQNWFEELKRLVPTD